MIHVANHLPLRFDSKGNARSRIPARVHPLGIALAKWVLITAALIAACASL
jgi:hypothetical protein